MYIRSHIPYQCIDMNRIRTATAPICVCVMLHATSRGQSPVVQDVRARNRRLGSRPAKWCVFSFVTQSRSLAIGQLSMQSYFKESFDLAGYGFSKDHNYHSWEFRSNVSDTWPLWSSILGHINAAPDNR